MSRSRFFKLAKYAGAAGAIGGAAYLGEKLEQKQLAAFQKEHPGAVVKREFKVLTGVGGFWKFSVDEDATRQKADPPTKSY